MMQVRRCMSLQGYIMRICKLLSLNVKQFFAQVEGHVKGSARIAEVLSDSFGWGEKRIFLEQLHNGKLTENYF